MRDCLLDRKIDDASGALYEKGRGLQFLLLMRGVFSNCFAVKCELPNTWKQILR